MARIAMRFPEEAAAFQRVMAIRMPDATKAVTSLSREFQALLKRSPKDFKKALLHVRKGVKPKSDVSAQEINAALRLLGADQQTATRMLQRIYENAASYPVNERLRQLEALMPMLDRMVKEARDDVVVATRALRDAQEDVRRLVESPEIGRVIGVPGISGRIVPSQVIDGKLVLGRDVAAKVRQLFGYMPRNWGDAMLDRAVLVASVYRMGKASFDLSMAMIQGLSIMGMDAFNLMTAPVRWGLRELGLPVRVRITNAFLPGVKGMFLGFIDPRHELAYWGKPGRMESVARRVRLGGVVQASEFTEGQAALQRFARKVPMFGNRLARLVGQTYGRADAAWSAGRNIMAQTFWEANEHIVDPKHLGDLAKMTNLLSGAFSFNGVAMPETVGKVMSAFLFFAPRFTFAQFALLFNIFRGGLRSRLALEALAGTAATNTMVFSLLPMALGQKPTINPLPKSMGGDGADVWTVRVGSQRYGIGGLIYSPMRLASGMAGSVDSPDDLYRADTRNPIVRWFKGKTAGPTSELWAYLSGRNFIGERVRSPDNLLPNKDTVAFLRRTITPIWVDDLEDNPTLLTAIASWFGLRFHPMGVWDEYRAKLEEADDLHRSFDEIPRPERSIITARNPEVKAALDKARAYGAAHGWNPTETEYWERYYENEDAFNRMVAKVEQRFLTDPLYGRAEVRRDIAKHRRALWVRQDDLRKDPRYAEVLADLLAIEPKHPVEVAWDRYTAILTSPDNWDDVTNFPKKSLDEQMEALERSVPPDVWKIVQERSALRMINRPYLYQSLIAAYNHLRPYWEIEDEFARQHPPYQQLKERIARLQKNGYADGWLLERSAQWRAYQNAIGIRRRRKRQESPWIDALLKFWEYSGNLQSAEGMRLWKQLMAGEVDAIPPTS
jgi:hypothetical protein